MKSFLFLFRFRFFLETNCFSLSFIKRKGIIFIPKHFVSFPFRTHFTSLILSFICETCLHKVGPKVLEKHHYTMSLKTSRFVGYISVKPQPVFKVLSALESHEIFYRIHITPYNVPSPKADDYVLPLSPSRTDFIWFGTRGNLGTIPVQHR